MQVLSRVFLLFLKPAPYLSSFSRLICIIFLFRPPLLAPGSQERRTTVRGLRLITGSVCKWSMKTASHKSNKNQSRGLGLFNGGYRTTQLRWTKGAFQKSELAGRTRHFQNEISFFQEENHVLPAYYLVFEWSGWIVKSQILLTTGMIWLSDKYEALYNKELRQDSSFKSTLLYCFFILQTDLKSVV